MPSQSAWPGFCCAKSGIILPRWISSNFSVDSVRRRPKPRRSDSDFCDSRSSRSLGFTRIARRTAPAVAVALVAHGNQLQLGTQQQSAGGPGRLPRQLLVGIDVVLHTGRQRCAPNKGIATSNDATATGRDIQTLRHVVPAQIIIWSHTGMHQIAARGPPLGHTLVVHDTAGPGSAVVRVGTAPLAVFQDVAFRYRCSRRASGFTGGHRPVQRGKGVDVPSLAGGNCWLTGPEGSVATKLATAGRGSPGHHQIAGGQIQHAKIYIERC